MEKFVCELCGYVYDPAVGDPDNGVAPGTAFADIPDDWGCPLCGAGKGDFVAELLSAEYAKSRSLGNGFFG